MMLACRPQQQQLSDTDRESLEAVAYLGIDGPAAPAVPIPIKVDKARAQPGATLYLSAHAPEAFLIDLDGNLLHQWHQPAAIADPVPIDSSGLRKVGWRRVALLPNGDLVAVQESSQPEFCGVALIDAESNLRWFCRGNYHHDVEVQPDGTFCTLGFERHIVPRFSRDTPIREDFIATIGADGVLSRRVSILAALESSDFAASTFLRLKTTGDLLHTNDIEVLDGRLADRSPAFRKGNVLVSMRNLSMIAVVDLDKARVVWALSGGMWAQQHEPTVLENGHMLVFDNTGPMQVYGAGRKASRVIEFDPFTQQIYWQYPGDFGSPLFSERMSGVQRLPNGNTLIVESEGGRALEVSPDLQIVWEFHNPHRANTPTGLRPLLYDAHRLPPNFPLDWCTKPQKALVE